MFFGKCTRPARTLTHEGRAGQSLPPDCPLNWKDSWANQPENNSENHSLHLVCAKVRRHCLLQGQGLYSVENGIDTHFWVQNTAEAIHRLLSQWPWAPAARSLSGGLAERRVLSRRECEKADHLKRVWVQNR